VRGQRPNREHGLRRPPQPRHPPPTPRLAASTPPPDFRAAPPVSGPAGAHNVPARPAATVGGVRHEHPETAILEHKKVSLRGGARAVRARGPGPRPGLGGWVGGLCWGFAAMQARVPARPCACPPPPTPPFRTPAPSPLLRWAAPRIESWPIDAHEGYSILALHLGAGKLWLYFFPSQARPRAHRVAQGPACFAAGARPGDAAADPRHASAAHADDATAAPPAPPTRSSFQPSRSGSLALGPSSSAPAAVALGCPAIPARPVRPPRALRVAYSPRQTGRPTSRPQPRPPWTRLGWTLASAARLPGPVGGAQLRGGPCRPTCLVARRAPVHHSIHWPLILGHVRVSLANSRTSHAASPRR
jgi:hypothetical protein